MYDGDDTDFFRPATNVIGQGYSQQPAWNISLVPMTSLIGSWIEVVACIGLKLTDSEPQGSAHKTETMKKKKSTIKQSIIKELQDCCFAVALDTVYRKEKMSNTAKKEAMYNLIHGNPNDADSMGLLKKLATGVGKFSWKR